MERITEKEQDFKRFEKELYAAMCEVARKVAQEYLEQQDKRIMEQRDTEEYRSVGNRTTTVKTLMGEVTYSRRYYKTRSGEYVFLLDEAMGIGGEYGLVSENLAERIVKECTEKSFRKAAGSISGLTGQTISAMGAWNVFRQYGEAAGQEMKRLVALSESGVEGQLGNLQSRVIFNELDDVWISRQRAKRRKAGTAAKGAKKVGANVGKQPMHVGTAYTGWKQEKDGSYSTINKLAYASFGKAAEFNAEFEALLSQRFDMDGVERRITNGDGDPWIRAAAEENDTILQLDPFHRSQAIIKAVRDKGDRKMLFEAIRKKDVDSALAIISELAMDARDESAQEKLVKLYGYFYNNRDNLLTWRERGVELPKPPEGVVYREMGTQESSNCSLVTQRMKHRRGSWSENGANNMARILCFRNTIGLDAILGTIPEAPAHVERAEPLSAAKSPQCDGKGYGAEWLRAEMPFENAFRTNGREAIRGLLRMRPLSQLAFL
jgi:hypothetical protein